jgi:hypothetical protein
MMDDIVIDEFNYESALKDAWNLMDADEPVRIGQLSRLASAIELYERDMT